MEQGKITILHVYKDFHVYNAFFGSLLLLARHTDFQKYNLKLCVFKYQKSSWGGEFERLGGTIIDLGANNTESPGVTLKLLACFRKERPHIVQTHELKANLYGRLAARMAHVPIVIGTIWTLKDTAPSPLRRLRDRCLHPVSKILDRQSDTIVTSSNAIRREWDASLASPLYETIYTPYNLDRLSTVPMEEPEILTAAMNDKKVKIGVVSRLSEEKGIQYLLQAVPLIVEQFPDFEIYIAGEGAYRKPLEALAKSLQAGSRVKFLGHVSDVRGFLGRLDLFVQPSRSESLGVAIMEAMSMGLPVVATNVGGIPEIVAAGASGILVLPCHPELLAKSIAGLCRDPETRKRMGGKGRELIAQKFRVADFVQQTFGLYERLLERKGFAANIRSEPNNRAL
jgi:glycosyltransferase involved in cell wall biosynthesis